ncbi:phage tail protein [Escherichia coli]
MSTKFRTVITTAGAAKLAAATAPGGRKVNITTMVPSGMAVVNCLSRMPDRPGLSMKSGDMR